MLQGNNVRDEVNEMAIFQKLSSNSASMEGSKCLVAFSCFPGNHGQQADAEHAYIQADVDDTYCDTFVRIPKEYWPKE